MEFRSSGHIVEFKRKYLCVMESIRQILI